MNVRESLGNDHKAIEQRLDELSNAVEGANWVTILEVFRKVDRGLRAHIDGEERYLFPHFEASHPETIEELRAEHAHARKALDELMIQTELHTLRKEPIDELLGQLRTHAAKENRTLYAWADERPLGEPRNGLFEFLEERRTALRDDQPEESK